MNAFSKFNLPMTLILALAIWGWLALFSVVLGSLL